MDNNDRLILSIEKTQQIGNNKIVDIPKTMDYNNAQ